MYDQDYYTGSADSLQTPDALIQKSAFGSMSNLDHYEVPAEPGPFNKEEFRKMIRRTYKQFYGKFKDQFNPDEYMQCVERENMVGMFGSMLEYSPENVMTPYNMPCIDLGEIPDTHSFMRAEADQVYYVPHNRNPDQIYVRYS